MKELSETEWYVLESLWADSPKIGSQIVADLSGKRGWSRSTTLTMLRRMTEKKLIVCDDSGKVKSYIPLIAREEAVKNAKFFGQGLSGQCQHVAKRICRKTKADV